MNFNLEKGRPIGPQLRRYRWHLLIMLPVLAYYVLFSYIPMGGIIIAFLDYNPLKGYAASQWVGFKWFEYLISQREFFRVVANTLIINFYNIIFGFPAPIILALLFVECRNVAFKRVIQTLSYLPHFISWSIIAGLMANMLSPSTGIVNQFITLLGGEAQYFISDPRYVRGLMVGGGIWKGIGWGSILYLAALTNINPELYEAATLDGAGKLKQIWHVTLPSIMYLIIMQLIFTLTGIFDVGFEQAYVMVNPGTASTGTPLSLYIYQKGIQKFNFSYPTAAGLMQSLLGMGLLLIANGLARVFQPDGALF